MNDPNLVLAQTILTIANQVVVVIWRQVILIALSVVLGCTIGHFCFGTCLDAALITSLAMLSYLAYTSLKR